MDPSWKPWYDALAKPSWTPAGPTIGAIWGVLYPVIFLSFGFVFVQALRGRLPPGVALPFALNLVANLAFTPIQFSLRRMDLASLDILVVLATLPWACHAVAPHHPWVAWVQLPYFVWVSVATVLQLAIWAWN